LDEPALGWRDVARLGRNELASAAAQERRQWSDWQEGGQTGPMPKALIPQFRWAAEKKLRQLEPDVTDDDLVIAKKIQVECTQRIRAILAHSGPKRSVDERLEVQRRLRDRSKRLADAVRNGRDSVARAEGAGLIPETRCRQVEVEVEAERQLLEGKLKDWTRQLEAGQIRYNQCEDQVEKLKTDLVQEQDRHASLISALERELQEQTASAKQQLDDLIEFERQAVPLVEAYHRLKNDMVQAEQRSHEWRERLLSVAGQYADEIQKLAHTGARESSASQATKDMGARAAYGADLGATPGPPPGRAQSTSRAQSPPRSERSPPRPDQQAQDLSLIHAEALKTTELLEREIDALRDAVRHDR
jgi:chromosome segregation ATPase